MLLHQFCRMLTPQQAAKCYFEEIGQDVPRELKEVETPPDIRLHLYHRADGLTFSEWLWKNQIVIQEVVPNEV